MAVADAIGISRTLYPDIVVEHDDICQECLAESVWENVDLHEAAVELEQMLESRQESMPVCLVRR